MKKKHEKVEHFIFIINIYEFMLQFKQFYNRYILYSNIFVISSYLKSSAPQNVPQK